MKKLFVLILTVIFAVTLWGCSARVDMPEKNKNSTDNNSPATSQNSGDNANLLTRDEALEIALNKAGVTKDGIRDLETELDRDGGRVVWEIDFEFGNTEYSYDIHAETGEILNGETDIE